MGGSELNRTNYFQKFCGSGLDRIQFYRIRTVLGLKNFTVRSSLVCIILLCFSVLVMSGVITIYLVVNLDFQIYLLGLPLTLVKLEKF